MPAKFEDSEIDNLDNYNLGSQDEEINNENNANKGFEFYEITPEAKTQKQIDFTRNSIKRRSFEPQESKSHKKKQNTNVKIKKNEVMELMVANFLI